MNHLYLEEFERKIEYTFLNKHLLRLALTHSSYANEIKRGGHENNERLEFLGDAVLDMVVSEYMYRQFPQMPEGELTKLRAAVVCEGSLAELARKLGAVGVFAGALAGSWVLGAVFFWERARKARAAGTEIRF